MTAELEFSRASLSGAGFEGWVAVSAVRRELVAPGTQGIYLLYREADTVPEFLERSPAGTHKGKDPTEDRAVLADRWVRGAHVVYIGKADLTGTTSLQKRLWDYIRQGRGRSAGHWGGRYAWQLADSQDILAAWRVTATSPRREEEELRARFVTRFGKLPFANLAR